MAVKPLIIIIIIIIIKITTIVILKIMFGKDFRYWQ
jgi:hypothetical protein